MNIRPVLAAAWIWTPILGCSRDTDKGSVAAEAAAGASSSASTRPGSGSGHGGATAHPSVAGGDTAQGASGAGTLGGHTSASNGSSTPGGHTSAGGGNGSSNATSNGGSGGGNTHGASAATASGGSGGGNTHGASGATASGGSGATVVLPDANASFDYQIGGAYTPPAGVRVVSRDRNSPPAAGLYNICYVNGFQIQPDEESFWMSEHPTLVLRDTAGNPVIDEGWDEMLLDTSTPEKRSQLATIVGEWISGCKTAGYAAIEVDNLDSYSRSNGLLTRAHNVAFMTQLSTIAHARGLAIAQKNSSELLGSVPAMGTDFAVVEECNRYAECGDYQAVYGNRLFIIEYRSQDFDAGCRAYPELSIVLRDLEVSPPGDSSYVYQGC